MKWLSIPANIHTHSCQTEFLSVPYWQANSQQTGADSEDAEPRLPQFSKKEKSRELPTYLPHLYPLQGSQTYNGFTRGKAHG